MVCAIDRPELIPLQVWYWNQVFDKGNYRWGRRRESGLWLIRGLRSVRRGGR